MPEKCKVVLLGAVGSGKSAMTVKYLTNRFITDYDPYIDCKYSKLDLVDSERIVVKIWDTYTHARTTDDLYRHLKWADGVIIVYSLTDNRSFRIAENLLKLINRSCFNRGVDMVPSIVVANKSDLTSQRRVTRMEGCELAARFAASKYLECSAARNLYSVEAAFHSAVRAIRWPGSHTPIGQSPKYLSSPTVDSKQLSSSWSGSLPRLERKIAIGISHSIPRTVKPPSSKSASPKLALKKSTSTLKLFSNMGLKLFS